MKWRNFEDSENTWEPAVNLNCPKLIEKFNNQQKQRPAKASPKLVKEKEPDVKDEEVKDKPYFQITLV